MDCGFVAVEDAGGGWSIAVLTGLFSCIILFVCVMRKYVSRQQLLADSRLGQTNLASCSILLLTLVWFRMFVCRLCRRIRVFRPF